MANAAALDSCCFKWDLFNPFLPGRKLEATFHNESPTITRWKSTIRVLDRRINQCEFSFSLVFKERHEIIADNIIVLINLNGESISRKEAPNYFFGKGNGYTYHFREKAVTSPQMKLQHLAIEIEISLPENTPLSGLYFDEVDLRRLQRDLRSLLTDPQYANMRLLPRNGSVPISAHSYVIDARWDNFFRVHESRAINRGTVQTNISEGLLLDILAYMYSGRLGTDWPDRATPSFMAELFQVIGKYKLRHLQKFLLKSDLQQVRVTRTPELMDSCLFRLLVINGRTVNNVSHLWYVDSPPDYELVIHFRVKNEDDGPWLWYSVLSRCRSIVRVRVNLEVVKDMGGNAPQRVWSLHEKEHTIVPSEPEPCEPVPYERVLFLGCPETFGDLSSASSEGEKIQFFIRCFLNVTDGATVNQVKSEDKDALKNHLEQLNVLSDSLHELHNRGMDTDFRIQSRQVQGPYEEEYLECIHKGILAIRVPNCLESLEVVPSENDTIEIARSTLSYDTLPLVLDYVYTGKTFMIPKYRFDEIEDFAQKIRFFSLQDFVRRSRRY